MSNSYTPPDRSTYDPGWNDPPPMPTAAPPAAKPRTSLNKRIAFPMQSGTASTSSVKTTTEGLPLPFSTAKYQVPPTNENLPAQNLAQAPTLPPPPPSASIFNPNEHSNDVSPANQPNQTQNETFDSVAARNYSNSIFMRLVEAMSKNLDAGKLSEIRKRIELLNEMWETNKIDESVQKNLYDLSRALDQNDVHLAEEQHRLLVTHHMNISTQWASALRQIIHSISVEADISNDAPVALPDNEINVVQFMNVSAKPTVVDAMSSPFLHAPISSLPTPIEPATFTSENIQTYDTQPVDDGSSKSKSKSGRFGPILHL